MDIDKEVYTIETLDKLLEQINKTLPFTEKAKKERGEVFTPMTLVNEMLDTLPKEVWKNPNLKWLDPAAGMGNFPVAVYMRLMEGLKYVIKDEEERRRWILKNMLYMVELDKTNVFMMKKIFCGKLSKSSKKGYELNIFEGSFIDGKYEKIYKTDINFDIIMGNPPYNKIKTPIWNIFINDSFKNLNKNGYLLFVTPSGWRDISGEFYSVKDNIYQRNLLILKIHNEKDGLKTFNCETRFDIILVENKNVEETTTEIYYQNIEKPDVINIKKLSFIPNGNINFIKKLLANEKEEKVNLLYDSCSYHTQKDWIKDDEDKVYKHKCIYTINSNSMPTFKYSRIKYIKDIKQIENKCLVKNIEHFGNSKLIWSNGRIKSIGCYIDKKGLYGLTQFAYAILESDINILNKLKDVFLSKKFKNVMEDCAVTEQSINYKIIALFKKDFYKYFT
jgi:16S rRNA G966 N2-methylase RsmD